MMSRVIKPLLFSMLITLFFNLLLFNGIEAAETAPVTHQLLAADYQKKLIAVVNKQGKILWKHKIKDIHDLQYLENGNILFQTSWTMLVEMTPEKKIVWRYDAAKMNGNSGKRIEVHSFRRLAKGVTMIAESGSGRIIEVDRKGKILKQIQLKLDHPNPHRDTRLVQKTKKGTYLVSHEGDGKVREYDAQGKVIWQYDLKTVADYKKYNKKNGRGTQLYCAIRLKNGNTLIGTGDGHCVIEVDHKTKKIVWGIKENDLPNIKLVWVTKVQELANGNIVIGNCHAGKDNPQIIEVNRQKKVVWTFKDFKNFGNALPVYEIIQ